jgi:hypothetical protein
MSFYLFSVNAARLKYAVLLGTALLISACAIDSDHDIDIGAVPQCPPNARGCSPYPVPTPPPSTATARIQPEDRDQQPALVAPPAGGNLGPNTIAGRDYSPGSGSVSNGASGSSIPEQEGGGFPVP